jgi:EF hand domain-containing protein
MTKLATLTSLALLLSAGIASAQSAITSGPPSAVLTPDQCDEVWRKAVTKVDTRAQADAVPDIVNFAQVDTDFSQVDTNNDGTVDKEEFEAACGKGLVHEPPRVKE